MEEEAKREVEEEEGGADPRDEISACKRSIFASNACTFTFKDRTNEWSSDGADVVVSLAMFDDGLVEWKIKIEKK